jgi:hypothetical protein
MKESGSKTVTTAPKVQKLERKQTFEKEHKDALERAVSLNIPHAVTTPEEVSSQGNDAEPSESRGEDASNTKSKSTGGRTSWNEVVKKLFTKDETGELHLKGDVNAPQ